MLSCLDIFTESSKVHAHTMSAAGHKPSALFVHMGGEGASGGIFCNDRAREHNAVVVQVEHRFYGLSVPRGMSLECNVIEWCPHPPGRNPLAPTPRVETIGQASVGVPDSGTELGRHEGHCRDCLRSA